MQDLELYIMRVKGECWFCHTPATARGDETAHHPNYCKT